MLQSQIYDAQAKNCSLTEPLHYRYMLFMQTDDKQIIIKKWLYLLLSRKFQGTEDRVPMRIYKYLSLKNPSEKKQRNILFILSLDRNIAPSLLPIYTDFVTLR